MIQSRGLARELDTQPRYPTNIWQTKLESRCHRSRQKPWKLLRNQKVAGRPRRAHWPAAPSSLGAGNFCEGASHVSPCC